MALRPTAIGGQHIALPHDISVPQEGIHPVKYSFQTFNGNQLSLKVADQTTVHMITLHAAHVNMLQALHADRKTTVGK